MDTSLPNSHATPLPEYLNPQIILFWKAPLRPYKKRAKHVLRFYIAVALLLSVIVFFFGDRILLVIIWSLLFLFYTLTITPPPIVENKITKFGIETAGVTMRWETLSHFYFTQRFGYDVLTVVTQPPYSLYAYIVIPTQAIKEDVMRILAEHILYQDKPRRTVTDRMVDWLSRLIPDDEDEETVEEKTKPTGENAPMGVVLEQIKHGLWKKQDEPEKTDSQQVKRDEKHEEIVKNEPTPSEKHLTS